MSYVGHFSELIPIDTDEYYGVRITDMEQWEALMYGRWSGVEQHAVYDELNYTENYPKTTYKTIRGFAPKPMNDDSNDPRDVRGLKYHIPNFGYGYGDDFRPFWRDVSRCTDPFAFYHCVRSSPIPRADTIVREGGINLLHVVARDGELTLTEFEVGITGLEQ